MRVDAAMTVRRYAIPAVVVCACAVIRFALPARSAVITSDVPDKLTVYGGVVIVVPKSIDALEFGNAGRDIVSTREIFLRPGATSEGSYFVAENGMCAEDGKLCATNADCDLVAFPNQTCLNNRQNLMITGDLTVDGAICFQNDCITRWPNEASSLWDPVGTDNVLRPKSIGGARPALRIGDSWGACSNNNSKPCLSNSECLPSPPGTCIFSNGLKNTYALSIYASTQLPALNVRNSTTIGTSNIGSTNVYGAVYVDGTMTRPTGSPPTTYWHGGSPTDTQDGSGIDAAFLDGDTKLPFANINKPGRLQWYNAYKNPVGKTWPGLTVNEGGGGIAPLLCVPYWKADPGSMCLNGANAGKTCSADAECVANESCVNNTCSVTLGPCTGNGDCPGKTSHPADANNHSKCQQSCRGSAQNCEADNIMRCSLDKQVICTIDDDCAGNDSCTLSRSYPPYGTVCTKARHISCTVDADCPPDDNCGPGKLFPASPSPCTNNGCLTFCRTQNKCEYGGTGACSGFAPGIRYNSGQCVTKDSVNYFCHCSLNVRDAVSLPYIRYNAADPYVLCGLPFDVSNQPHPVQNP